MTEKEMVTLTVSVAVAGATRMQGETYQQYLDRLAAKASRYVNESLRSDNRMKVLDIRGAR